MDPDSRLQNSVFRPPFFTPPSAWPAPVGVIIPCFNAAETICRAVDSVRRQTWRPAELILVDDASDDETLDLLNRLRAGEGDPADRGWIRVLRFRVNRGPGAARNAGWDAATQPLLAFLDADDVWRPAKLMTQAAFMLENPRVALSGHRSGHFGREVGPRNPPGNARALRKTRSVSGSTRTPARRISAVRLLAHNLFPARSVMLRRSLPFRFAEDKRRSEDYLLWLEIALSGRRITFLDVELAGAFKRDLGAGGLTIDPARMAAAERDTYRRLWRKGRLGTLSAVPALAFSGLRYAVRRPRWALKR
ncbi:MAG: glycosyltransferase family 2 protein [Desulfococcaceae bacterium]